MLLPGTKGLGGEIRFTPETNPLLVPTYPLVSRKAPESERRVGKVAAAPRKEGMKNMAQVREVRGTWEVGCRGWERPQMANDSSFFLLRMSKLRLEMLHAMPARRLLRPVHLH